MQIRFGKLQNTVIDKSGEMKMADFIKRTWAEINLDAAVHNYNEIRKRASKSAKVCCVIKADGYGHGAVMIAHLYEKLGAGAKAVAAHHMDLCGSVGKA